MNTHNQFSIYHLFLTADPVSGIIPALDGLAFYLTAFTLDTIETAGIVSAVLDTGGTALFETVANTTAPTSNIFLGVEGLKLADLPPIDLTVSGFTTSGFTGVTIIGYYGDP